MSHRYVQMGMKNIFPRKHLYINEIPCDLAAAGEDARVHILCIVFARSRAYENDLGRRYRPSFQLPAMAALRA